MLTTDRKMLMLPDLLKSVGLIALKQELYDVLGVGKQHFGNVKNAENYGREYHFTAEHIRIVCKVYGVNANWIADLEDNWQRNPVIKNTKKAQNKVNY